MAIRAVIWDLDGTLLNTLDDLAASTNAALEMNGLPLRTREEVRRFVGNGIALLIERAVPEGYPPEKTKKVLGDFVAHYAQHNRDTTRPYDGIPELLAALAARGIKMGIVSNKIDFAVRELSQVYFGDLMQVTVGDDPSRRRKPAPDSVLEAMRRLGVDQAQTLYVGDSDVDVMTARNAGVTGCAVSWGFRSEESLRQAGAQHIVATPAALLALVESL